MKLLKYAFCVLTVGSLSFSVMAKAEDVQFEATDTTTFKESTDKKTIEETGNNTTGISVQKGELANGKSISLAKAEITVKKGIVTEQRSATRTAIQNRTTEFAKEYATLAKNQKMTETKDAYIERRMNAEGFERLRAGEDLYYSPELETYYVEKENTLNQMQARLERVEALDAAGNFDEKTMLQRQSEQFDYFQKLKQYDLTESSLESPTSVNGYNFSFSEQGEGVLVRESNASTTSVWFQDGKSFDSREKLTQHLMEQKGYTYDPKTRSYTDPNTTKIATDALPFEETNHVAVFEQQYPASELNLPMPTPPPFSETVTPTSTEMELPVPPELEFDPSPKPAPFDPNELGPSPEVVPPEAPQITPPSYDPPMPEPPESEYVPTKIPATKNTSKSKGEDILPAVPPADYAPSTTPTPPSFFVSKKPSKVTPPTLSPEQKAKLRERNLKLAAASLDKALTTTAETIKPTTYSAPTSYSTKDSNSATTLKSETGNKIFDGAFDKLYLTFTNSRVIVYALAAFSLAGFAVAAIFGKFSWIWLTIITISLFVLASAEAIISYAVRAGKGSSQTIQAGWANQQFNSGSSEQLKLADDSSDFDYAKMQKYGQKNVKIKVYITPTFTVKNNEGKK